MTDDIKAIRDALAAGPAPGPWRYWSCKLDHRANPPMYDYAQFANPQEHVFRAPLRYITEQDARYIAAVHPERIARLLDALEQASKDAERWRWLAENGSIGFEGAPGWRTVVHFDTFDMAANTLDAAIDAAMGRGA